LIFVLQETALAAS